MYIIIFILFCVLTNSSSEIINNKIVKVLNETKEFVTIYTKYGEIQGFKHLIGINNKTREETKADVFLGLPFAKPPIEKLRFEKPEAPVSFDNGKYSATKFPPSCASIEEPNFSEDCLYLNVITPSKRNSTAKLPVVVWIHGGGFTGGSTKMYGYEALAANFASREIVVVTIQYRLGAFGKY